MTDDEFLLQLREAFAIEAAEHVQTMTSGLLELEKGAEAARQKELIETTFRATHSLKGAAGAVGRNDLQTLCQALENVFSEWKHQPASVAAGRFDLLSSACDLVGRLLKLPDVTQSVAELQEVNALADKLGERAPAPAKPAAAVKPSAPRAEAPPPPAASPAAPESEGLQMAETVRLPLAKMDSLLRQAEEMIGVKHLVSQHAVALRGMEATLETWHKEWAKVHAFTRLGLARQNKESLERLEGFLIWNQGQMRALEKQLNQLTGAAKRDERGIGALVDDLLQDVKRLVMLPFGTLLDLFPKLVRDLARASGKEADLTLEGREVEIDKRILQEIKDPLIHLMRNAVDHGLETTEERQRAHKSAWGKLTLAVSQREGGKVEIVVSDDGAGISVAKVKKAAIRCGTLTAAAAAKLDEQGAIAHIFDSGVSTSGTITEVSGRGLGMAIVREKVEKLGGQIRIETQAGAGTTFRLVLPITLATCQGILVSTGGQSFIIPTAQVECIQRVRRADIQTVENRETMNLEGHAISFVRLQEVLELPPCAPAEPNGFIEVVVLGSGEQRIGFAVDEVLEELEVLVKNLGKPLLRVRNVAGATMLGSGTPAIILSAPDLLKSAVRRATTNHRVADPLAHDQPPVPRLLIVDDSVTSRMLLKNVCEASGYQVTTAVDGLDAFTALKQRDFDLVISDVEMPRMDGFELTRRIRADKKLAEIPIVLVTALSTHEDQVRGMHAGANAYIMKSRFNQSHLLETIRKLV